MFWVGLIVPIKFNFFSQFDQNSSLGRCFIVADFDAKPLATTLWNSEVPIFLQFIKHDFREADRAGHLIIGWTVKYFYV